jgi:hypothetical protein
MTKLAYFECPTGIAGDMCLGALVHAGVPLEYLIEQLGRLGIADAYQVWAESVLRNGQTATKVHVAIGRHASALTESVDVDIQSNHPNALSHKHHDHAQASDHTEPLPHHHRAPGRHLPEIEQLITKADIPDRAKAWSLQVFRKLGEAEGAVHGISPEQVHFHEVGATDAIVDIVGTCLGLDWLGIEEIYCSALPTGGGMVHTAHGLLPVPTPAVVKLWESRQVPVYSNGIHKELVTPTGAAIATTFAKAFGAPPAMALHRIGLGAGSKDLPIPNILRLWLGEQTPLPVSTLPDLATDVIAVLETQIDDLTPQAIAYALTQLLAAGALDVFTQPITMKKSRSGILLTVICPPKTVAACEQVIFRETTTLGIRRSLQYRTILNRDIHTVPTPYGEVRVKVAWSTPDQISNVQPEYEDCAQLAQRHQLPWREVHRLALQTWYEQHRQKETSPLQTK